MLAWVKFDQVMSPPHTQWSRNMCGMLRWNSFRLLLPALLAELLESGRLHAAANISEVDWQQSDRFFQQRWQMSAMSGCRSLEQWGRKGNTPQQRNAVRLNVGVTWQEETPVDTDALRGEWNSQQKLAVLPQSHFGNDMFALLSGAAGQASCGKMMSVMRSDLSRRRLRRKDSSRSGPTG